MTIILTARQKTLTIEFACWHCRYYIRPEEPRIDGPLGSVCTIDRDLRHPAAYGYRAFSPASDWLPGDKESPPNGYCDRFQLDPPPLPYATQMPPSGRFTTDQTDTEKALLTRIFSRRGRDSNRAYPESLPTGGEWRGDVPTEDSPTRPAGAGVPPLRGTGQAGTDNSDAQSGKKRWGQRIDAAFENPLGAFAITWVALMCFALGVIALMIGLLAIGSYYASLWDEGFAFNLFCEETETWIEAQHLLVMLFVWSVLAVVFGIAAAIHHDRPPKD